MEPVCRDECGSGYQPHAHHIPWNGTIYGGGDCFVFGCACQCSVRVYIWQKQNLDIRNGLIMMVSVLAFTVVGSYVSSLVPSATMGNFSVFMTFLLGIKFIVRPVMTTKEAMQGCRQKTRHTVCDQWHLYRIYLWIYRCRRRHDDASYTYHSAWI